MTGSHRKCGNRAPAQSFDCCVGTQRSNEIVSLLKKIYKRDAPFRAVFKVKTLAVLFPPYPREMKTNTAKFNLPPFCRLLFCMEMQTHSHARSIARAWLKHAHSFDRCELCGWVFIQLTKMSEGSSCFLPIASCGFIALCFSTQTRTIVTVPEARVNKQVIR